MSCAADLFAGVAALITGDSGAGGMGLAGDTNNAYIRGGVWRKDDADDRGQNWPKIVVEIIEDEDTKFAGIDTIGTIVKFNIQTPMLQKNTFVSQNAILARMRAAVHRATPAATASWTFTDVLFRSGYQGPATRDYLLYVLPARCFAREV